MSSVSRSARKRTTVLLADDHAIVAEGLARLLGGHEFDVVGAVGNGSQLISAAKRLRPDVIVTDLSMPGMSGLDVLARLKADGVESKLIVLTMHDDAGLATSAIRAGAVGSYSRVGG
jgi:DNA-binding NarL/FixJ family response regulator